MEFKLLQLKFMILVIDYIADKSRGTSFYRKCKILSDEIDETVEEYKNEYK